MQFNNVDLEVMGTYEQESSEQDTGLEICRTVQIGDMSARLAPSPGITNNSISISLGLIYKELVDKDMQSEDGDVSI